MSQWVATMELRFVSLVGLFILKKLSSAYPSDSIGLYIDDGLVVFKNMNPRSADKARKVFCKILGDLGLKITVQSNLTLMSH